MAISLVFLMFMGLGLRFLNDKLLGSLEWESQRHHSVLGLYTQTKHQQQHFQKVFFEYEHEPLAIPTKPSSRKEEKALKAKHAVEDRYTPHELSRRETQYDPSDLPPPAPSPALSTVFPVGHKGFQPGATKSWELPPFPKHGQAFLEALMADSHGAQARACLAEAAVRGAGPASLAFVSAAKALMETFQDPRAFCPATMTIAQGAHAAALWGTPAVIISLNTRYNVGSTGQPSVANAFKSHLNLVPKTPQVPVLNKLGRHRVGPQQRPALSQSSELLDM